ncbi:MAG: flagellar export chaperone FliS [Gemmatimonadetes bacterium]|nr:flagellar export chaperone FliS [Gemmatimonadota bacterium]
MNRPNGYGQYKQVQINTASPGKLILLLYQGAIKSLKKSLDLMDRKDFGGKGDAIIKAQDILMELNMVLDHGAGEIAHSLQQIYLYAYKRLVVANLEMDRDAISEIVEILENLYEAWEEAVQKTEGIVPVPEPRVTSMSVTG